MASQVDSSVGCSTRSSYVEVDVARPTLGAPLGARPSESRRNVASRFVGDGEAEDDYSFPGRILPPEDRLWRHPSEFADARRSLRISNRRTVLFSAMGGALLMGALWITLGGSTKVKVATERVALVPIESVVPRVTPADDWIRTVTDVARPATAAVRLRGKSENIAGAVSIRDDGYLITSSRALAGAEKLSVVTASGAVSEAVVVGTDLVSDLTLLKVHDQMPAAVMSNSGRPESGESLAVVDPNGNPESRLVIQRSAVSATESGDLLVGVISLDGTIGSLLAGSPAVDSSGAVVGVVLSTSENAPVAVMPIDMARSMADEMISAGHFVHPKAGITARDVMASDGQGTPLGALVTSVEPNGPAADSGMLVGDVIVEVGGAPVSTMAEMVGELMGRLPGDRVDFLVVRNSHQVTCHVVLAPTSG